MYCIQPVEDIKVEIWIMLSAEYLDFSAKGVAIDFLSN